jgi:hypothetical protein
MIGRGLGVAGAITLFGPCVNACRAVVTPTAAIIQIAVRQGGARKDGPRR